MLMVTSSVPGHEHRHVDQRGFEAVRCFSQIATADLTFNSNARFVVSTVHQRCVIIHLSFSFVAVRARFSVSTVACISKIQE